MYVFEIFFGMTPRTPFWCWNEKSGPPSKSGLRACLDDTADGFKKYVNIAEYNFRKFDGKCQNLQMFPTHFCNSSYRFRDMKKNKFFTSKREIKVTKCNFAIKPFDDKCLNLQMSSTHFCANPYRFSDIKLFKYEGIRDTA